MIPYLDNYLEWYRQGNAWLSEIICYIVRMVATEGTRADFHELPGTLQDEVIARIEWYRHSNEWKVITSNGGYDMAPHAETFMQKIGYPGVEPRALRGRAFWDACVRFRRSLVPQKGL